MSERKNPEEIVREARKRAEGFEAPALDLTRPDVDVEKVKQAAALARQDAEERILEVETAEHELRQELKRREDALKEELELRTREIRADIEARKAEVKALMEPLQKEIARLNEGIWMINLYLGSEDELHQLRAGTPAASAEAVVVRQLILAMDQEAAVAAEDGGIDSFEIHEFDAWLMESWDHVNQVIPEQKAVVACVPRFDSKMRESIWEQTAAEEGNQELYFLIRNGDNLYRIVTAGLKAVGPTILPRRGEWEEFFEEEVTERDAETNQLLSRRRPLVPGTDAWTEAEEQAGARQRHYMRVGLVLQGLADRTEVFAPHDPPTINFLARESEYVRLVFDADLTLGTGRLPYKEWLAGLIDQVGVGERIVGDFEGEEWRGHRYQGRYSFESSNSRLTPPTTESPRSGELYVIEERDGTDGFRIRFHRTESHLSANAPRASCLLMRDDRFWIPFDRVTAEECQAYLDARLERAEYTSMFPTLKAVIKAKREEEERERPFVEMLAGVLAREHDVSVEEARAEVPELVDWYKFERRYFRPLVLQSKEELETNKRSFEATIQRVREAEAEGIKMALKEDRRSYYRTRRIRDEAEEQVKEEQAKLRELEKQQEAGRKAVKAISAEFGRRLRDRRRPPNEELINGLADWYEDFLVIGRKRDGRYVLMTPQEDAPEGSPFVTIREYLSSGEMAEELEWRLPERRADRWQILREGEAWAEWDRLARPAEWLTGPEMEEAADVFYEHLGDRLLGVSYEQRSQRFKVHFVDEWEFIPGDDASEYREERLRQLKRAEEYDKLREKVGYRDARERLDEKYGEGNWSTSSYAYDDPTARERNEERGILTGRIDEPQVESAAVSWRRVHGKLELSDLGRVKYGSRYSRKRGEEPWKDDRHNNWGGEPFRVYPDALKRLWEGDRRTTEAEAERGRLLKVRDAALRSVREQWEAQELEKIRVAFWEEYGDAAPKLWPAHMRKTKLPKWPSNYDEHGERERYRARRFRTVRRPGLDGAVERLLERGFNLRGHQVRELPEMLEAAGEAYPYEPPEDVAAIKVDCPLLQDVEPESAGNTRVKFGWSEHDLDEDVEFDNATGG